MNENHIRKNGWWFWGLLGIAFGLKFGYEAFRYYPILDDWIQYGVFQQYAHPFQEVFLSYTYHTRPLASLFDLYIWGKFWPDLSWAFILLTILHFASCYLLYRIFRQLGIALGAGTAIIFGLIPLASEGVYWISASSRVLVGVFLMLISLFFLVQALKGPRKVGSLIGFFIFQLLSFGMYEQIIAMGAGSAIAILLWKGRQRLVWLPILNVVIIGLYYVVFKEGGNAATRGQIVPLERLLVHTGGVFHEFYDIVVLLHAKFYSIGFGRGLRLLVENQSYMYMIAISILSLAIGWTVFRFLHARQQPYHPKVQLLAGVLLIVLPLSPFFILDKSGLALRNVLPPLLGFALFIDGLLLFLIKKEKGKLLYSAILGCLTCIFIVVNVADIVDYKRVSQTDRYVAEQIIAQGHQSGKLDGNHAIYLFGADKELVEVGVPFLNHVRSTASSDWALTGNVRALANNRYFPTVRPILQNEKIVINEEMKHGILLGLEPDMRVVPLRLVNRGETYELLRLDHTRFNSESINMDKVNGTK
ncbi:hypothetical protein [Aneurinibacillus sp. REN35]|uniref:hypothetical protein n=1 Tax=Aneurinibacillus sp. REN35 TaxID=3237286 RepID=UPI0035276ED9